MFINTKQQLFLQPSREWQNVSNCVYTYHTHTQKGEMPPGVFPDPQIFHFTSFSTLDFQFNLNHCSIQDDTSTKILKHT